MNKNLLSQIEDVKKEIKDIEKRIKKIEEKADDIVRDSVTGSSNTFPYIKHNCVVEGENVFKSRNIKKYKKILNKKKEKLQKKIIQLEYDLNYIEDPEIRKIIRHKYVDNMNWVQIMFAMKYDSESKARMKMNRFFNQN